MSVEYEGTGGQSAVRSSSADIPASQRGSDSSTITSSAAHPAVQVTPISIPPVVMPKKRQLNTVTIAAQSDGSSQNTASPNIGGERDTTASATHTTSRSLFVRKKGAHVATSTHVGRRGTHAAHTNTQGRTDYDNYAEVLSAKHVKNSKEPEGNLSLRDFVIWCAIPIAIVVILRVFLFGMYVIPSRSMEDTILPGDRVLTTKLSPKPISLQRGDIVVFKDPANWLASEQSSGEYLIKRLIGLPGDIVECDGNGAPIVINGVAIDESSYIKPGSEPSSFAFKVKVTEGHVFVLGDNRANSADSRYHANDGEHGLVPISDVVGVAFARYWPLNRISWLSAHHDVFKDVPSRESDE